MKSKQGSAGGRFEINEKNGRREEEAGRAQAGEAGVVRGREGSRVSQGSWWESGWFEQWERVARHQA